MPVGKPYTDALEYPASDFIDANWTQVTSYTGLAARLQEIGESAWQDPFSAECQSPDQGAQRLTISAFSDDQEDKATLDVIVRNRT